MADKFWIEGSYFYFIYRGGCLLDAIESVSKRWSFNVDGACCNFSDESRFFKEDHFDGL
ncbi:ribonuclease toxin immunity protein CdiI [Achromobacter ruhlandii]|uniref:ribonuclease toxin immunity protein CdiI n=1 Tax=Achromobacter ruhlandii TaxID=72557 RepID=UPI003454A3C1